MHISARGAYGVDWHGVAKMCGNPKVAESRWLQEAFLYLSAEWREELGTSKAEHLRNMVQRRHPELVWHRWVQDLCDDFCGYPANVTWGPANAGKSYPLAAFFVNDLMAAPLDTVVMVVTDKLGNHDRRFYGKAVDFWKQFPDWQRVGIVKKTPEKGLFTKEEGEPRGIICRAMSKGDAITAFKGVVGDHPPRARLVLEEAQACSDAVLLIQENFFARGDCQFQAIGNPTDWGDALGKLSPPRDFLKEQTTEQEVIEWTSKYEVLETNAHVRVLDGRNSPSLEDPALEEILFKSAKVKGLARRDTWSLMDWSQTVGRIPPAGVVQVLIAAADIEAARGEESAVWRAGHRRLAAVDLSGGGDGDKCPIVELLYGDSLEGRFQVAAGRIGYVRRDIKDTVTPIFTQLATQIYNFLRAWGLSLPDLSGDATGQQGMILSALESLFGFPQGSVTQVRSEGPPTEREIWRAPKRTARERYKLRSDELLFQGAAAMRAGVMRQLPQVVIDQATSRMVLLEKGFETCEPKKDWRERMSGSPDELDAVNIGIEKLVQEGLIRFDEEVEMVEETNSAEREHFRANHDMRAGHREVLAVLAAHRGRF